MMLTGSKKISMQNYIHKIRQLFQNLYEYQRQEILGLKM
jgi:hypothetical protein